ncbi:MAG: hypothetical protein LC800_12175 [Acidobacteria bacterium]|nr:hypothetical protein [Acidobacteriota bacterium]
MLAPVFGRPPDGGALSCSTVNVAARRARTDSRARLSSSLSSPRWRPPPGSRCHAGGSGKAALSPDGRLLATADYSEV